MPDSSCKCCQVASQVLLTLQNAVPRGVGSLHIAVGQGLVQLVAG